MSAQVRDMTKGSPAKLILLFAVPLMLGNIFQQLYTMVDTIVVGQVAGVQALAALGAVEWISPTDLWDFPVGFTHSTREQPMLIWDVVPL